MDRPKKISMLNMILCHHREEEKDHCIPLVLFGRKILLCSRCLGLYPFALLWLVLSIQYRIILDPAFEKEFIVAFFFPAFLEWSLSGLGFLRSRNSFRFLAGFLASFALGRYWFLWGDFQGNSSVILSITVLYLVPVLVVLFFFIQQNKFNKVSRSSLDG